MRTGEAAMDAVELERLSLWFKDKWKHGPCPVCTETRWLPNPKILQLFNEETMRDGSVYPVMVIFGGNCGYTILANARIAGVKVDDPPVEPSGGA
jgi:hypothetical protein